MIHFEPSLDTLDLRSGIISSIKMFSFLQGDEQEEETESWSGVGMSEGAFERLKEREGDIEHVAVSLPLLMSLTMSMSRCRTVSWCALILQNIIID